MFQHPGRGIDVRRRKIWDMYGPQTRLEVLTSSLPRSPGRPPPVTAVVTCVHMCVCAQASQPPTRTLPVGLSRRKSRKRLDRCSSQSLSLDWREGCRPPGRSPPGGLLPLLPGRGRAREGAGAGGRGASALGQDTACSEPSGSLVSACDRGPGWGGLAWGPLEEGGVCVLCPRQPTPAASAASGPPRCRVSPACYA